MLRQKYYSNIRDSDLSSDSLMRILQIMKYSWRRQNDNKNRRFFENGGKCNSIIRLLSNCKYCKRSILVMVVVDPQPFLGILGVMQEYTLHGIRVIFCLGAIFSIAHMFPSPDPEVLLVVHSLAFF